MRVSLLRSTGLGLFLIVSALFARNLVAGKVLFPAGFLNGRAPYSLHSPPPPHALRRHQGDVVQGELPLHVHAGRELLAGRVPLWFRYHLAGTPFRSFDGGTFFPLHLLAVPFPISAKITVLAISRLLLAGLGMILLLRHWKLSSESQALGAITYAYSFMMFHYATQNFASVGAMVPWMILAGERFIDAPGRKTLACLAIAIGLTSITGTTQVSAQLTFGAGVYVLIAACFRTGRAITTQEGVRSLGVILAGGLAASILGIALAGIHLVPVLELLPRTWVWFQRTKGVHNAELSTIGLWLAPNAHGFLSFIGSKALSPPSFVVPEAMQYSRMSGYVGLATLALLPASLVARPRHPAVLPLLVFLAVAIFTIYDILGFQRVYYALPLIGRTSLSRSLYLPSLAAAALAAFGLEALLDRQRRAIACSVVAAVLLAFASLWVLMKTPCPYPVSRGWIPIVATLVVGALLVVQQLPRWVIPTVIAAELLLVLSPIFEWTRPATVFPDLPEIQAIAKDTGGRVGVYNGIFPPLVSGVYRVHDIRTYSVLMSLRWFEFYRNLEPGNDFTIFYVNLTTDPDWARIGGVDRHMVGAMPSESQGWTPARPPPTQPAALLPGKQFQQIFSCGEAGRVHQVQVGWPTQARARFSLKDATGDVPISNVVGAGGSILLQLEKAAECSGTLTLDVVSTGNGVPSWPRQPDSGKLVVDGVESTDRTLWLNPWSHRVRPTKVEWLGALAILHTEAHPFAWLAETVIPAEDETDAVARMKEHVEDPGRWAVIEGAGSESPREHTTSPDDVAQLVERSTPNRILIRTRTSQSRQLVVQESWDADWRVFIDGRAAGGTRPTNLVFQSIEIPAGEHQVELRYRPVMMAWGALLSAIGILVTLALIVRVGTRQSRARTAS